MPRAHGSIARGVASALVLSLTASTMPAQAADKGTCVDAAESAQRLKKAHRLLAARERLLVCSSTECPSIVSTDCTSWLGEVARSMASITVTARDGRGQPLYNVRVLVDGAPFAPEASGTPLDVDPGPHVIRCERGPDSVNVSATLEEGERGHPILCDMPSAIAPAVPATGAVVAGPVSPPTLATPVDRAPIPAASWILGGLGVVAAGSAAVFGGLELGQQSADAAPGGCKPHCSSAEIGSIQSKIDVAYVSAGVAVVALGVAVTLALLRPSRVTTASMAGQFPLQVLPASPW